MLAKPPFRILRARGVSLSFGPRPLVMGILNVTPDSFSDGGAYASVDDAVAAAQRMIAEGADLIDVGGESTRPGHQSVNAETELSRVIPVIERLAVSTKVPISIDTSKAVVASAALKAGAHIVNDIWGLSHDDKIAAAITNAGAAVIIMHNREALDGSLDIFADMKRFFAAAADKVRVAGAGEDQIMVDPGIGFGKTLEQNLSILGHLERMHEYGYPVLLGASRKSFIGKISPSEPSDRLGGSVVTTVFAALAGISIVRVHDVAAHVQALKVIEATSGAPA
jgi:dihydropteroate synthase